MEWKSVILNEHAWWIKVLGEYALLLELVDPPKEKIDLIIQTVQLLKQTAFIPTIDLVPAYQSIGLIFDSSIDLQKMQSTVLSLDGQHFSGQLIFKEHEIPTCYEKGLDWEIVEAHTKLDKSTIIAKHTAVVYRVAMTGFLPGFVYLSGMDEALNCPRKKNPRIQVPPNSIGIGGTQTGIYALPSPGGWQIIGQSPLSFFNTNSATQSSQISQFTIGDSVRFIAIDAKKFDQLQPTI